VIGGDYTLHGVQRMHERPIGDLVDALNAVGAQIEYTGTEGFPPLRIRRGHIIASRMSVRGNVSSQFLTALLMAAPLMAKDHPVTIEVAGELISKPYIEITLNLMRRFGVTVEQDGWAAFTVQPGQRYHTPGSIRVEGDASSASYFLAAGAIAGGPVRVEGVGRDSIQGDVRFADALEQMGVTITRGDTWIEARSNGVLRAIDADFNHIPDAAMTIAVAALYADGPSTLRNIASWRVKETDRLAAMAIELRRTTSASRRPPSCRRPRSIPTTTTGWRCASRWLRWTARRGAAMRCASTIRNAWPRPSRIISKRLLRSRRTIYSDGLARTPIKTHATFDYSRHHD
jgi:3-phosphoshikimate 1-carboxyvinyltransferase